MKLKNRIAKLENILNIKKDFLQYLLIVDGRVLRNNESINEDEFYNKNQCLKNGKGVFKLRVKSKVF